MKLEDVELKIRDVITFNDGSMKMVGSEYPAEATLNFYDRNKIVKIERQESVTSIDINESDKVFVADGVLFRWIIIYEKKEEVITNGELKGKLRDIQSQVDSLNNEIRSCYSKVISARDRVGYLKKRVSEIQGSIRG